MTPLEFVGIESPYSGKTTEEVKRNIRYARACVRDCILKGEVPVASHLLYTQTGILDDNIQGERDKGILAGQEVITALRAKTVIYTDLGISGGMLLGERRAVSEGRVIEFRQLGINWEQEFAKHEGNHYHNGIW